MFMKCIPNDWFNGYENVTVGCTIENQDRAYFRLEIFSLLPIKHKVIICQPIIDRIDIGKYLKDVEVAVAGCESEYNGR